MFTEHITTALTHIRRSPYQALAAILIMSLTFFVASIVAALAYSAQITLRYLETRPQIIVFLKDEASGEAISALQRKLIDNIKITGDVKYVSKDEALKIFQEIADNPLVTELVPSSVLPASLEFSVADLSYAQEIIDELKRESIVDSIQFTGSLGGEGQVTSVVESLERITRYIRLGGIALLGFLSLVAILILVVIIGMRVATRREEIDTLRLIGATAGFIRIPFLLEGVIYGVIGALVGFVASTLMLLYSLPALSSYFGEIPIVPQSIPRVAVLLAGLFGAELVLAVIIGLFGSVIALSRYLRV